MSMIASVLAKGEELAPLIMPPLAFAAIAIAVFTVLGFVTWSHRDVSHRHHKPTRSGQDSHGAGH